MAKRPAAKLANKKPAKAKASAAKPIKQSLTVHPITVELDAFNAAIAGEIQFVQT